MDTKSAVVETNPSPQPSKQTTFPFLRLPRELRDTIYCDALAAGSLGIVTICKFVHQEASQLVSKHAVLRVNLGFANRTNWSQLGSGSVASSIQHVHLRISARSDASSFRIGVISGLNGSLAIRKSCIVTLHYEQRSTVGYADSWRNNYYRGLARLNGFKSLTFKIAVDRCLYNHFQKLITAEEFDEAFPFESMYICRHRESYMYLRRYLERFLGPATFDDSVGGHCLTFHPLEAVPEDWSPEWKNGPRDYNVGYRTW